MPEAADNANESLVTPFYLVGLNRCAPEPWCKRQPADVFFFADDLTVAEGHLLLVAMWDEDRDQEWYRHLAGERKRFGYEDYEVVRESDLSPSDRLRYRKAWRDLCPRMELAEEMRQHYGGLEAAYCNEPGLGSLSLAELGNRATEYATMIRHERKPDIGVGGRCNSGMMPTSEARAEHPNSTNDSLVSPFYLVVRVHNCGDQPKEAICFFADDLTNAEARLLQETIFEDHLNIDYPELKIVGPVYDVEIVRETNLSLVERLKYRKARRDFRFFVEVTEEENQHITGELEGVQLKLYEVGRLAEEIATIIRNARNADATTGALELSTSLPESAPTVESESKAAQPVKTEAAAARELPSIPQLDIESGRWVRSKNAARLEHVATDTLRTYRSQGTSSEDGLSGIDNDGRTWRKPGKNAQPWYLRSSLRSSKK